MDLIAPDDMAADILLQPAVVLAAADGVALHLRRALHMLRREKVIVLRIQIFAKADACALAAPDLAVLDDPALRPVRADHAVLVGCRRRPGRRCLVDVESLHSDIAPAGLRRHEALPAHVDLDLLLRGIRPAEVRVDHGLVRLRVLLGVPLALRRLRVPGALVDFARDAGSQVGDLVERLVVQPHAAGVLVALREVPVAEDPGLVRVVPAEDPVLHSRDPDVSLNVRPVRHDLRAGDDRAEMLLAPVDDARVLRTSVHRIDVFAVDARRDHDFVTRLRDLRCVINAAKRSFLRAVAVPAGVNVDIDGHSRYLLLYSDFGSIRSGLHPPAGQG